MRRALTPSLALLALLVPPARSADEPPTTGDEVNLYRACGLNCLALVLNWRGEPAPLAAIEAQLKPQPNGDSSVADIERAARLLGLQPTSVLASMGQLPALPMPAIVHIRSRSESSGAAHYLVVVGLARRGVLILDAPRPLAYMPYEDFARVWSGVAVAFPRDRAERDRFLAEFHHEAGWAILAPALLAVCSVAVIGATLLPGRARRAGVSLAAARPAAGVSQIVLAACLSPALLLGSGGCGRTPAPPRLALGNATVDLGVQEAGSVPFVIPVRNSGGQPLLIYQARSSCACTVAEVPEAPILPQDEGVVRGRVTIKSGEGSAEVLLATNEPGEAARRIRLTWFGKHVPTLSPGIIEIKGRRGEDFERVVELSYPGGDASKMKVEYLGVDGLPPATTLSLLDNNPAALQVDPILSRINVAGRATFRLRTRSPAVAGDQATRALIRIRQHGVPYDLPLTISFHVDEGVRAVPANLMFSGSTSETLRAIRRRAMVDADQPLGGLAIVSKPEYLDLQVSLVSLNRASVDMRVIGAVPAGINRGEIVLRDASGRRASLATVVQFLPEPGGEAHASTSL